MPHLVSPSSAAEPKALISCDSPMEGNGFELLVPDALEEPIGRDRALVGTAGGASSFVCGHPERVLVDDDIELGRPRRRLPRGVDYIETSTGEVSALWAAPKNCAEDRVLLCAHGGGYAAASTYTHRKTYGHMAKTIGCRALIVDYQRAPENVHPGPVNDMAQS
jgi:acetyl esterase/lipase